MKSSIANGESRGSINNILLKALQSGDKYGYEINKEIETKSKGKFFLKEASLYSGLKRLEANGYITSYWQDGELGIRRHYYSITESGLEKLNSSNFTWDDSKTFISEMFKDSRITKNIAESNNNLKENLEEPNENIKEMENANIKKEIKPEIKKNPFQIEVSPLQQSIFDLSLNQEPTKEENIKEEIETKQEKSIETEKVDNTSLVLNSNEEKTDIKNEENLQDKTEIKYEEQYLQVSYQDILNNYTNNGYSQSLLETKEKVDISKYLLKDKANEDSIIIENSVENTITKPESLQEEQTIKQDLSINDLLNNVEISKETINENKTENIISSHLLNENNNLTEQESTKIEETSMLEEENNKNNTSTVDIKNIFGSLLVDETKEETKEIEILEEEVVEKPIVKQELPRINIDNDINITLNSNRMKTTPPAFKQEEMVINQNKTSNVPSVKQYINNVHKKTLISRATTVEEEVNLDGINIREYRKMNNKVIRNSNYIYKNKVNLFITLLLSFFLITESVVSLVVFNNAKCLGIFEVLILSFCITACLGFSYYKSYVFVKDKFKVELKNYNFKNALFYCSLIFVVAIIIFVCINIFQGMHTNNLNDFIIKIILEFLICFNIVLYPLIKLWFYKLKMFSN